MMRKTSLIVVFSLYLFGAMIPTLHCRQSEIAICLLPFTTDDEFNDPISDTVDVMLKNLMLSEPDVEVYEAHDTSNVDMPPLEHILEYGKVDLVRIGRETGFDGLVAGSIRNHDEGVAIRYFLVDFASGRVHRQGEIVGVLSPGMFEKLTNETSALISEIRNHYDCEIKITSDPDDADVYVDDVRIGTTPVAVRIGEGMHRITISRDGYENYVRDIDVTAGQKLAFHARLTGRRIAIVSDPPGASLLIDGEYAGETPMKNLIPESPKFNVILRKKGYVDYSGDFDMSTADTAMIYVRLRDRMTEHLIRREHSIVLDSHNFSIESHSCFPGLDELGLSSARTLGLRYLSKFRRWNFGIRTTLGYWDARQTFDTFLGKGEGKEDFTVSLRSLEFLGQFDLIERLNQVDLFLGIGAGIVSVKSSQSGYRKPGDESRVSPEIGAELGVRFYLGRTLKLTASIGKAYGHRIAYYRKIGNYWGEPRYEKVEIDFSPLTVSVAATYSFWPSLYETSGGQK